jgi:hypothetical protein
MKTLKSLSQKIQLRVEKWLMRKQRRRIVKKEAKDNGNKTIL